MTEFVLGLWDGHDAGAALLRGGEVLFAINEERLTRRKLEVGFPGRSIAACLEFAGLVPGDLKYIAASTTDPAKTLTRLFPGLKEEYYLIRRRKKDPKSFDPLKKAFKYRFTELAPNLVSGFLSRRYLEKKLQQLGFRDFHLALVDHHAAHAVAAAFCSGFPASLVITLDGVGDGCCASVWKFRGGEGGLGAGEGGVSVGASGHGGGRGGCIDVGGGLGAGVDGGANGSMELLRSFPARTSLGIFFEHVTNLMNMRELEDEGKVMALANYAYPIADHENPLMKLIGVKDGVIVSNLSSTAMFAELRKIIWRYPSEQFAAMAQRVLEKCVLDLVRELTAATGLSCLAVAGGVFSNIKLNMKIAALKEVERIFVFPHMGDGGLAIGAAMHLNRTAFQVTNYRLNDLYLGPVYARGDIEAACREATGAGKNSALRYEAITDAPQRAARFIMDGEIILWYRGRMEIGPRSLGNRSILARPDNGRIKDRLNVLLKKRVWYQPFCPSILAEDGAALLHAEGQRLEDNRFMTMAFRVREEHLKTMEGVINIDGTCRPQFVGTENPPFRELLLNIKKELGYGAVLNTSFNIHGEPLVCSPGEALEMLRQTGIRYLFMEDIPVENTAAQVRRRTILPPGCGGALLPDPGGGGLCGGFLPQRKNPGCPNDDYPLGPQDQFPAPAAGGRCLVEGYCRRFPAPGRGRSTRSARAAGTGRAGRSTGFARSASYAISGAGWWSRPDGCGRRGERQGPPAGMVQKACTPSHAGGAPCGGRLPRLWRGAPGPPDLL